MARSNQTALTPTKKSTLRPTAPKNHIPSFILAATLALLTFIAWQQLNSPSGLNTPSPLPANHPPAPSPAHVPPPPSPQPPTSTSPTPTTQPLGNPIVPVTTEPTLTVSSQPLADPPVASPLRSAPDAACCASATLARRSLVPNGADPCLWSLGSAPWLCQG